MQDTVYHQAVEIQLTECEQGEGSDTWDACPWCDEVRFVPGAADARAASAIFGALEDALDEADFQAWLDGLQHERFRQVTQAIDVLRGALAEYGAGIGVGGVRGWMEI